MSEFELERYTKRLTQFFTHEMFLHSSSSDVYILHRAFRECKDILSEFGELELFRWVPDVDMVMQLIQQAEPFKVDADVVANDVAALKNKIYGMVMKLHTMAPLLPMRKIESGLEDIELMLDSNVDIGMFLNIAIDINDEVGDNQTIIEMQINIARIKRVSDNLALLCYWLEMQIVRKSELSWQVLEMPIYHKKKHKRIPRMSFPDSWSYQQTNKYFVSDTDIENIRELLRAQ